MLLSLTPSIRSERRQLGQDVTKRLVCALVLSRIDYCNVILAGLSASTLAPLQRVLCVAGGTSRARPQGVATGWTGMDMSTLLLPEVVSEIDANTASFYGVGGSDRFGA